MSDARPPNFIVVLCDDLGYGDIEPYGGVISTPALSRMAAEGLVATDYYAPANICTPSRAGMLTGRYPIRTGLGYEVILPGGGDERRLPHSELTLATALKPAYVSGIFGKWHLGHVGDWLPTNYGFDEFFGIPYSHDMTPLAIYQADATGVKESAAELPLLQQQFYGSAADFIERNRERPFLAALALSAPHLPAHAHPDFDGASDAGAYGDVVREIDDIVGRLLDHVRALSLERETIVIFTSDNGPWYEGSTLPLRDRKGGAGYDGGYRVPFIAWAPGRIAPGSRTDAICCGIDLLPTFCALAGVSPPEDVEIDGRDVSGVLLRGEPSAHDEIVLFDNEEVVAIRTQRWKYVARSHYRSYLPSMERAGYPQLYDMSSSPSEHYSVAARHPDALEEMRGRFARAKEAFAPFKQGVPPVFQQLAKAGAARRRD